MPLFKLSKICDVFGKRRSNIDAHGGSEILQTYPSNIKISQGSDKLQCIKLKNKGIDRWYASCCKTPVANTMGSAKIPFAGVSIKLMKFASEDEKSRILGPVIMKAFGRSARGKMPEDAHATFPKSFMFKMMKFMLIGKVGSKNRPSPFYEGNTPVAKAKVLS